MVSGADRCLFLATNGVDTYYEWIEPSLELQEQILTGWEQFKTDLSTHNINAKIIKIAQAPVMELPSVIIQVRGELTLCNIDDVRPVFDKFLSEATVTLVTDNDFATAEAESKKARDIAKRCIATEKSVIDQTATISEVTRAAINEASSSPLNPLGRRLLSNSTKVCLVASPCNSPG